MIHLPTFLLSAAIGALIAVAYRHGEAHCSRSKRWLSRIACVLAFIVSTIGYAVFSNPQLFGL